VSLKTVLVDALLAAVLTVLCVATLSQERYDQLEWPAVLLAALTVAPIALRQIAPVITMSVIVLALAAFVLYGYESDLGGGFGLVVAMFTVATLRPTWVATIMFTVSLAAAVLLLSTAAGGAVWPHVARAALSLGVVWALGETTRRWARRVETSAGRAERAVAAERVRIARELHDNVAHHLSVISLQAGVAEYVLDDDPATARNAIATVGGASRDALLDMRRLLDVLRVDQHDEPDLRPQPGLAQLDELAERTRSAGLPVTVTVTGSPRALPSGIDLCAYRVAQESLTNILKHAGPASARVDLRYQERTIELTITDDGAKQPPYRGSPDSYGIRGMRERADLYGGLLTAGPNPAGGFAVVLRLPLQESP
jgi:signal transduction histidine kinase